MRDWPNSGKDVFGREDKDCGRGDSDLFNWYGGMGNGGSFLVYYLVKSKKEKRFF